LLLVGLGLRIVWVLVQVLLGLSALSGVVHGGVLGPVVGCLVLGRLAWISARRLSRPKERLARS
jgi:hypothetical protein